MICGSWCSKSSLAKAAGAEVAVQQTDEKWHAAVAKHTYLADQQAAIGGFLPMFWRSSHDPIRATLDLGSMVDWISGQLSLEAGENGCLAVLHNRNDMVGAFKMFKNGTPHLRFAAFWEVSNWLAN